MAPFPRAGSSRPADRRLRANRAGRLRMEAASCGQVRAHLAVCARQRDRGTARRRVAAMGSCRADADVRRRAADRLCALQLVPSAIAPARAATVESGRNQLAKTNLAPAKMLMGFKGIGAEFAMALWSEGLFRHFDNRRQVGAYAGFAPTPWQSGMTDREQGIAKSGNPRLRTTMIQLAWLWLRHQPDSLPLVPRACRRQRSKDPQDHDHGIGAKASRRTLWKYVTAGVVIERAVMKTA